MKIISMYLPQFHNVRENNDWWGDGYTDWVAVKAAESYFEGHLQPRIPQESNYYDLLEKETMQRQADLMKQYGIDGVCMYHYWFKAGRRILEKPAENLLKWKDIDMPFCFYWDNQSWIRTWNKIHAGNSWSDKFEKKDGSEVLLEQDFGKEEQWKEHFDYLLPFFKDERYISIEDKPVFMFYKTAMISCIGQMIEKWNEWAKKEGLKGIYFIGAYTGVQARNFVDAIVYHEPANSMDKVEAKQCENVRVKSYDDVWKMILGRIMTKYKVYETGFSGFDDTPRRGRNGLIIEGQSPQKFSEYFAQLLAKSEVQGNEITFLNAWNEWGESMYLEPDEANGYAYLEAVLYAKENYKKFISKYQNMKEVCKNGISYSVENLQKECDRNRYFFKIFDKWMSLRSKGINVEDYLLQRGMKCIAIYGMGVLGRHLLEELERSQIEIKYIIDRAKEHKDVDIPCYSMEEKLPDVDATILTMVEADFIRWRVGERLKGKVITLQEIIDKIL